MRRRAPGRAWGAADSLSDIKRGCPCGVCDRERRGLGRGIGEQDQPFARAEPEGQLQSLAAGLGLGWPLPHLGSRGAQERGLVLQQAADRSRSPSWKSHVQKQSPAGELEPGSAAAAG